MSLPPPLRPPSPVSPSSSAEFGSPGLYAVDSSSALIIVNEDDERNGFHLDLDDDERRNEDGDENDYENESPTSPRHYRFPQVDPLSASHVLLYLLSPYLKLGALLLPSSGLPLKLGLPALFGFALLSPLTRQVWYMLSRYFRMGSDATLEDVVVNAIVGKSSRAKRRVSKTTFRSIVRAAVSVFRVGLAALYIRTCTRLLAGLDLIPRATAVFPIATLVLVIPLVFSRSSMPSLASRRIAVCTSLSIFTYFLWLICVSYSHAKGAYVPESVSDIGPVQGLAIIAFAFTSSSSVDLYASLRAAQSSSHPYHLPTVRKPGSASSGSSISRSFRSISLLSAALGLAMTLPLMFFAAHPNSPPAAQAADRPVARLQPFVQVLAALTLWFAVPGIFVTLPPITVPYLSKRGLTRNVLPRAVAWPFVVVLAALPFNRVAEILSEVVWVLAITGTYLAPAAIHMSTHFFRRPVSIITPSRSTLPSPAFPSSSSWANSAGLPSSSSYGGEEPPMSAADDELLQRKERSLQKRLLKRRIVWDIAVAGVLLPLGIGTLFLGVVWGVQLS